MAGEGIHGDDAVSTALVSRSVQVKLVIFAPKMIVRKCMDNRMYYQTVFVPSSWEYSLRTSK